MPLRSLIVRADELRWHDWVCVERGELTLDTGVAIESDAPRDKGSNMRVLLQVADFQSIFRAWSNFRGGRRPTLEQALRAIRYYDENDAFIPRTVDP